MPCASCRVTLVMLSMWFRALGTCGGVGSARAAGTRCIWTSATANSVLSVPGREAVVAPACTNAAGAGMTVYRTLLCPVIGGQEGDRRV
jgi:hypothetical protein